MKPLSAAIIIVILFFTIYGIFLFTIPLRVEETLIEIEHGESAFSIAQKLYNQSVIRSKNWFYLYVKLTESDRDLSYGKYLFDGNLSLVKVVEKLKQGKVFLRKLTIPEGYTIKKICRKLSKNKFGVYTTFMNLCNNNEFTQKLTGFPVSNLEGFLYPETYNLPENVSEEFIISHLVKEFFKQTGQLNFVPDKKLDFYETIILASIVEKEARFEDEKPVIASVYLNRIEYNYKLQADPTVAYILEQSGKTRKKIYYRDLEINSPFNTYKYFGLPPTPICSPSLSSIKAVLEPVDTDYFFFFAQKNGRHVFSQTYSQHLSKQRILKATNG